MKFLDKIKNDEKMNYITRVMFFSISVIFIASLLAVVLHSIFIFCFYAPLYEHLTKKYYDYWNEPNAIPFFICEIVVMYYFTKIFGLFAKLEKFKLNFFGYFSIIFVISLIIEICPFILSKTIIRDIIYVEMFNFVFFYIAFFLFKLFNFLTKKFPTPFKQIGYICSFECYKDLFLKIKNNLKNKNIN